MAAATDDTDIPHQLAALRPYLLKIARLQLRNLTWAEDVVSETVVTALEKIATFDHRAQFKTWVVAILRNKMIDFLRSSRRDVVFTGGDDETDEEALEAALFDARGAPVERPQRWPDPEECLAERQFLAVLEACVERLPSHLGRAFLMREWLEMEADDICRETGVSRSNLWVMLYRARLRLRACIEIHWLGGR